MITNFEPETCELTAVELEMAEYIRPALLKRRKHNAITSMEICQKVKELKGWEMTGARLRKIVRHLRMSGTVPHLMATSDGYFICTDPNEWQSYIDSLIERYTSIQELAEQMEWQGNNVNFKDQ